MDYIFDEDIFEVGAEVDAYCTRCKTDTPHTVLTKYEDEIRSVQCTTCNATHAYRPPRGDVEEEIPEPIAARRRQTMQKLPWEQAISEMDQADARPYSPKERYTEGQILDHPRFGLGYISELLSDTKLEAIFSDGRRILIHNRGDLDIVIAAPRKGARPVPEALKKKAAEAAQRRAPEPKGKAGKPADKAPLAARAAVKPTAAKPTAAKPTAAKAAVVKAAAPKAAPEKAAPEKAAPEKAAPEKAKPEKAKAAAAKATPAAQAAKPTAKAARPAAAKAAPAKAAPAKPAPSKPAKPAKAAKPAPKEKPAPRKGKPAAAAKKPAKAAGKPAKKPAAKKPAAKPKGRGKDSRAKAPAKAKSPAKVAKGSPARAVRTKRARSAH